DPRRTSGAAADTTRAIRRGISRAQHQCVRAATRPRLDRVPRWWRGHPRHSDMAHPRLVSRWDYHPPYPGFTHTVLPLFDPGLMIVSDEATAVGGADWPKLVWVVDVRDETNPVPIATCPIPPVGEFAGRGGRYGAPHLHEH